jgi:hypothetical protein
MSTIYALTTPLSVGTLVNPITVSSLQLTTVNYSSTPDLAPLGAGTLSLVLTDPTSGFQETVSYTDSSVIEMWSTIGDTISQAVFEKLIADGKLPLGNIATSIDRSANLATTGNIVSNANVTIDSNTANI